MTQQSRWDGKAVAGDYDTKWKQMAVAGQNPHGEVDFVMRFEPSSVLDAGCGTGRVAIELRRRGIDAVGADLDAQMLAEARAKAPDVEWVQSDLASLDLGRVFDVVVMAGNVILFVAPGTEADVVAGAARHVAPGGWLIAGFSLGTGVAGVGGITAAHWETWLRASGLEPVARYSTWNRDPFIDGGDYLVSVAERAD